MILAASEATELLVELGLLFVVLALVGRFANGVGLPTIPLYLIAGLMLGEGGIVEMSASIEFIAAGAELGVVILLLMLGLEYTPDELKQGLRSNWQAGLFDLVGNFSPGFAAGLLLGWGMTLAFLLGGVTYISSSGIIAKQLSDLGRVANRETPVVLTILVIEDLVMAAFLPLLGVLVVGLGVAQGMISIGTAVVVVLFVLTVASRYSPQISRVVDTHSPESMLLTVLGLTFLVGGLVERVEISAAVGAFLLGLTLSGQVAERGRELLVPVRDVFAGLFFVYFGLRIDPGSLPPVLLPAIALALVTAATKIGTGWWSAGRAGIAYRGRVRAAMALTPRGEFSIVIAGIGVAAGLENDLGPLAACYVLVLAVAGSLAMRYAEHLAALPIAGRLARSPA